MNYGGKIMINQLEMYLHYYIGSKIQIPMGNHYEIAELVGVLNVPNLHYRAIVKSSRGEDDAIFLSGCKLLLHPISSISPEDFTTICTICGWNHEEFVMGWFWSAWESNRIETSPSKFVMVTEWLIRHHYDVFGLIKDGLAVGYTESKES